MHNTKTQMWERQPGESTKAFEAFVIYRDMGVERSLRLVWEKLGKSRALIERWSSANHWVSRAAAYDNDLEKQAHRKKKQMIVAAKERQLSIVSQLEKKALEALENLKPENMSARDIKEILRLATDIERKILLEDESVADEQQDVSVADMIVSAYDERTGGTN